MVEYYGLDIGSDVMNGGLETFHPNVLNIEN